MTVFKRLAAKLPERLQSELKRFRYGRQIGKGLFISSEPEYNIVHKFIAPGDWVVDIGANIGYYTKLFSDLVGEHGRVIAFEPVPETFSLLAANVRLFANANVTLLNAAASEKLDVAEMSVPDFPSGLKNYSEAHLSSFAGDALSILTLQLDSICMDKRIALVKIDTEGHEANVLEGMQNLIKKHHPVLIIETYSKTVIESLYTFGYNSERFPDSPNCIFKASSPISSSLS